MPSRSGVLIAAIVAAAIGLAAGGAAAYRIQVPHANRFDHRAVSTMPMWGAHDLHCVACHGDDPGPSTPTTVWRTGDFVGLARRKLQCMGCHPVAHDGEFRDRRKVCRSCHR